VTKPDGGTAVAIASRLVSGIVGTECIFEIRVNATNAFLWTAQQGAIATEVDLLNDPGPDTWFETKLTMTKSSDGYVVVAASIDGRADTLAAGALKTSCPFDYFKVIDRLEVGVQSVADSTEIHFDDLVLETK
jgi:hypothetical protein